MDGEAGAHDVNAAGALVMSLLVKDVGLDEVLLNAGDGGGCLGGSAQSLGQYHEREAHDVEEGERGEGERGAHTLHVELVGGEDDEGAGGRDGEHEADVDGLQDVVVR